MNIAIAGCRDYTNYDEAAAFIDMCICKYAKVNDIVILSGGCRGADALGEKYAKEHGHDILRFPAKWDIYGRTAGIVRNKEIAVAANLVICFWDKKSKGTKNLIENANKMGKVLYIKVI